ncbi:MAG TPA: hypothetical protein IAC41_09830 [Candidatus Merdenecus merdavium]|nr:hypothetical protein [Candidatus Merdenecus merdavium]
MSKYLLCQLKEAKIPYYIKAISTNIYTIEELCFYLYHNVYLIDDSIINEQLCDWLKDELGLKKLYKRLYEELEKKVSIGNFVLPIFKEIHYLSHEDFKEMQEKIRKIEVQPEDIRKKLKGDYLVTHNMYSNAIGVYHSIITEPKDGALGNQFYADVWSNMGVAYAKLFLFEETAKCYEKAYERKASTKNLENYLCALWLSHTGKEFKEIVKKKGIDYKKVIQLEDKLQKVYEGIEESPRYQVVSSDSEQSLDRKEEMEKIIKELMQEYKRSTCS